MLDYTNLFYSNEYVKNTKNNAKIFLIIKKSFLRIDFLKVRMRKTYCINCKKYKEHKGFKNPIIQYICYKTLHLSSICNKCRSEDQKYLKKKNHFRS